MNVRTEQFAAAIDGLGDMDIDKLHELYSQMLATAHDVGYEAPDEQLVETDDPEVLRSIIPPLHDGLVKFCAGIDEHRVETEQEPAEQPAPEPKKRRASAKRGGAAKVTEQETASSPKAQQEQDEEKDMTTTATKKAPAKKAAAPKKAAPAKKVAKGKASAKANARTPAAPRNKWSEKATIKVLKENPCRKGTGRFDRVANLMKFDGKPVKDYLSKGGKTGTLSYSIEQEWVKVVG